MSKYDRAMKSLSDSLTHGAPRFWPVRPNDNRPHPMSNARNARQHAANELAARTRALMLPPSRNWRRVSLANLTRVWREGHGRSGNR